MIIVSSKVEKEECNLIRSPPRAHLLAQQLSQRGMSQYTPIQYVNINSSVHWVISRQDLLQCALSHLNNVRMLQDNKNVVNMNIMEMSIWIQ